jgi:hypothetical protein
MIKKDTINPTIYSNAINTPLKTIAPTDICDANRKKHNRDNNEYYVGHLIAPQVDSLRKRIPQARYQLRSRENTGLSTK